jgi:hypothetical protein
VSRARSAHAQKHPCLGGAMCESRRFCAYVRHVCGICAGMCARHRNANSMAACRVGDTSTMSPRCPRQPYPRGLWASFDRIQLNGLPRILIVSARLRVGSIIGAASRSQSAEKKSVTFTGARREVLMRLTGIAAQVVLRRRQAACVGDGFRTGPLRHMQRRDQRLARHMS